MGLSGGLEDITRRMLVAGEPGDVITGLDGTNDHKVVLVFPPGRADFVAHHPGLDV